MVPKPAKRYLGGSPVPPAATSPRSFYKIILPSIIHDHKLRIPEDFAKIYEIERSAFAILAVPEGRVFRVRVEEADKMLWFHDGWKEFSDHHSIHCGFFLVFDYEGNSNFKVHIFDLTGVEIQYPKSSLGICEEPNYGRKHRVFVKREKELGAPVRSPCSVPSSPSPVSSQNKFFSECLLQGVKRKICLHSLLPTLFEFAPEFAMRIDKFGRCIAFLDGWRSIFHYLTRTKRCKVENLGDMTKLGSFTTHKGIPIVSGVPNSHIRLEDDKLMTGSEKKSQHLAEDSVYLQSATQLKKDTHHVKAKQEEGVELLGVSNYCMVIPTRMTIKEKEKEINYASMLRLKNPYFMKILKLYNVHKSFVMLVPTDFATKYLASGSKLLKLQDSDGKQWPVTILLVKGKAKRLGRGWSMFVKDNNLVEGDLCMFELIQVDDVVLKVHIFRMGMGECCALNHETDLVKPEQIPY